MGRERQLAHKILNCGAHLNNYEIKFLTKIPHILKQYGQLTPKQYTLLQSLARRTKQTIEHNPKQIKHNVALLMFNDLAEIAAQMMPADKAIFRLQLRNYNAHGAETLDKKQLWYLFKKYRESA